MLFVYAHAQTTDQAIAHNDKIVADQIAIIAAEDAFVSTIVDGKEQKVIDKAFKNYLKILKKFSGQYKKMKAFDSNDTFRKAMIDLIDVFRSAADHEYREMVTIYAMDPLSLTAEVFERWEALTQTVNDKENAANEKFLNAQEEFALQYNFTLK